MISNGSSGDDGRKRSKAIEVLANTEQSGYYDSLYENGEVWFKFEPMSSRDYRIYLDDMSSTYTMYLYEGREELRSAYDSGITSHLEAGEKYYIKIESSGGYSNDCSFSLMIGDPIYLGETKETAYDLYLGSNSAQNWESLSSKGKVYFKFTPAGDGYYNFTVTGGYSGSPSSITDQYGSTYYITSGKGYELDSGVTYYILYQGLYGYSSFGVDVSMYSPFAGAIELEADESVETVISTGGQQVYYEFTATTAGTYTFYSTGSYDTCGYLYNSSHTQIAYNDDGGSNRNFSMSYTMSAGETVYLVAQMLSSSNTGSFYVRVDAPAVAGSSFDSAIELEADESVETVISTGGQQVYYEFTATTAGTYTFYSTGSYDTYGHLYNSSQSQISSADSGGSGSNFSMSYTMSAGQTVYLVARMYSSSNTGSFYVRVDAPAVAGSSFDSAIELEADESVETVISTGGQQVYYEFTATTAGTYTFYSTGSYDTYGYLYNSSQSQIASNDDGGNNNNFSMSYTMSAGETVYLVAKMYSSSVTGSFYVYVN